jgi:UDP-glucose 4-epimerase/phosphorylcholine metabolism protein LicD
MKKILITGSSGYIGQHLVKELNNRYQAEGLDFKFLKNIRLHQIDIRNTFFELDKEYDTVIHLAALIQVNESIKNPTDYYNTNVLGTQNLLKNVKFKNFIFASTGSASTLNNPYAISKKMAEDVVEEFCKKNSKSFTIFRFYNVIGSNGFLPTNPDGLFFNLIKAIDSGKFNLYGNDYNTFDGTCIRDYVHVREICKAIELAIETPSNTVENLGHGKGHSVKQIVDKFQNINNVNFNVIQNDRREGDLEESVLNNPSKYMINLYNFDDYLKISKDLSDIRIDNKLNLDSNVTILIKTFLRNSSLKKLICSIRKFYKTIPIVIVDDGLSDMTNMYDDNIEIYRLPFDSGASKGRNFGISKIKTKYFVTLDDDFEFSINTKLENFLENILKTDLDILGGMVYQGNVLKKYHGIFDYDKKNKVLICKSDYQNFGFYKKCQIIPQFFIAKTEVIKKYGWNDNLKIAEHTAFFFDNRNNFSVGFIENVSVNNNSSSNEEYANYRNRGNYFFKKWLETHNIRKFISLTGEEHSTFDKVSAHKNLKTLDKIFRKNKVKYWLTDGTLLGWYREKTFIGHDTDTDIGVLAKTFTPSVLEQIKNEGFQVYHLFGYPENSFEISLIRNNIKTDLFFFYKRGNKMYHSAFLKQRQRIDYVYDAFDTKEINFLGYNFFVPDNELKYIKTKYGESWNEPDPDWDWAYSPKNHIKTNIKIDLKQQKLRIDRWLRL